MNIEIMNLAKEYKGSVKGLDDVSFFIRPGIFGLLGHNGAGKTTLMKIISTILKPTAGTVKVMGHDIRTEGDAVRRDLGYLPQELTMYSSLSVIDFVTYMAALKGIKNKAEVNSVLEQVDLCEYRNRRIGQLSGGMKRRVGIAQAIVGNPRVLIVDEPTAGLDPEERVRFRGFLSRYAKEGHTVLLSTHIVEDVYQLCEELAVLRSGKLFFAGNSGELIDKVAGRVKIVMLEHEQELVELQKKAIVLSTMYEHQGIVARIVDEQYVFSIPPAAETLEDAYVYCMGGKAHG